MKIAVAGASGFVGQTLVAYLKRNHHEVIRLVRHKPESAGEVAWQPARHQISESDLEGVDAIVNLAGENIGAGRWTAARRARIGTSRFDATQTLVDAIGRMPRPPTVLISASGAGYYGSRGDETLTEESAGGSGFLAEVCREWERRAREPERRGVRTVQLRFGLILSGKGGALDRLRPIFRSGLGGRLGPGTQWMSWVSLTDAIRVIDFALENAACRGALNLTAPNPVTNAEFTAKFAAALHRPAPFAVPGWVLRLGLGRMADETLLASTRAVPAKLEALGFRFTDQDLASYLARGEL